jgi:hypothetical protein
MRVFPRSLSWVKYVHYSLLFLNKINCICNAVFTTYIYAFTRSLNGYDLACSVRAYLSLLKTNKLTPGTPWHSAWASNVVPGSVECKLEYLNFLHYLLFFFQHFFDYKNKDSDGYFYIDWSTLLCSSLFLIIVLHRDMEKYQMYFWCYLGIAVTFPFGISINEREIERRTC